MGHLHWSNKSSALAAGATFSTEAEKQPLLFLPAFVAAEGFVALAMTAAARLVLLSGCLICLPPMLVLLLAIQTYACYA